MNKELTQAQKRLLNEVAEAGEKNYNGRAARTIKKLRDAGYVEYDMDLRLHGNGSATELYTVRLVDVDLTGAGERGLGLPW